MPPGKSTPKPSTRLGPCRGADQVLVIQQAQAAQALRHKLSHHPFSRLVHQDEANPSAGCPVPPTALCSLEMHTVHSENARFTFDRYQLARLWNPVKRALLAYPFGIIANKHLHFQHFTE